jgi:serine/threonine-protein kinase RsbW/stage II sporulation protein AB (anti-sigma F factor)
MHVVAQSESAEDLHPALSRDYSAVAGSVPAARRALVDVAREAGAEADRLEAVALAVSEALTNAVVHAYPDRPGEIKVSAWTASGELVVVISDDGHGLRAHSDRPGLGVGLGLIATLSDEFEIVQPPSGGTEVQMRFCLSENLH